jgi:hypothetical protein
MPINRPEQTMLYPITVLPGLCPKKAMSLLNVRTRMPKPAAALSAVLWSLGCISLGVHKKEAIWVQFPYGQKISRGLNTGVVTTLMTFDSNQSPAPLIRKGTRREIQVSTLPFTRADSQAFKPADSFITSKHN